MKYEDRMALPPRERPCRRNARAALEAKYRVTRVVELPPENQNDPPRFVQQISNFVASEGGGQAMRRDRPSVQLRDSGRTCKSRRSRRRAAERKRAAAHQPWRQKKREARER